MSSLFSLKGHSNAKTKKTKNSDSKLKENYSNNLCAVKLLKDGEFGQRDALVLPSISLNPEYFPGQLSKVYTLLQQFKELDQSFENDVSMHFSAQLPIKRIIYSPIGSLDGDYDDVGKVFEATYNGLKRAILAGSRHPLLNLPSGIEKFEYSDLVSILGGLHALYVPLEIREASPFKGARVEELSICNFSSPNIDNVLRLAVSIESGCSVCRDIGDCCQPQVAHYVQEVFSGSAVKVQIVEDESVFQKDYPLFAVVNRTSRVIEKQRGSIIHLTYEPEGTIDTTLLLIGKGVTYDTGGIDTKSGGIFKGLNQEKFGAAAVAGFFQVLAQLKPKGIKVIGGMTMARNRIGTDVISDELITSRTGVRVRNANNDAEGSLAMTDLICQMKEKAINEINPYIISIGNGHSSSVEGQCSSILDNGPAKKDSVAQSLQKAGNSVGDMFEISILRKEDFHSIRSKSEYDEQSTVSLSSGVPHGHRLKVAFMISASGLDQHGLNSNQPLRYSHMDICSFKTITSGSPIAALVAQFLFSRL